jgi:hypothetical protein
VRRHLFERANVVLRAFCVSFVGLVGYVCFWRVTIVRAEKLSRALLLLLFFERAALRRNAD